MSDGNNIIVPPLATSRRKKAYMRNAFEELLDILDHLLRR